MATIFHETSRLTLGILIIDLKSICHPSFIAICPKLLDVNNVVVVAASYIDERLNLVLQCSSAILKTFVAHFCANAAGKFYNINNYINNSILTQMLY